MTRGHCHVADDCWIGRRCDQPYCISFLFHRIGRSSHGLSEASLGLHELQAVKYPRTIKQRKKRRVSRCASFSTSPSLSPLPAWRCATLVTPHRARAAKLAPRGRRALLGLRERRQVGLHRLVLVSRLRRERCGEVGGTTAAAASSRDGPRWASRDGLVEMD